MALVSHSNVHMLSPFDLTESAPPLMPFDVDLEFMPVFGIFDAFDDDAFDD